MAAAAQSPQDPPCRCLLSQLASIDGLSCMTPSLLGNCVPSHHAVHRCSQLRLAMHSLCSSLTYTQSCTLTQKAPCAVVDRGTAVSAGQQQVHTWEGQLCSSFAYVLLAALTALMRAAHLAHTASAFCMIG